MAVKKNVPDHEHDAHVVGQLQNFWEKYSKPIMIAAVIVILLGGGWYVYQNMFKNPKEAKAVEAMFKAEEYFRIDSTNLALNGDGQYDGFLKIISKFGGTDAANLASFYAGSCYIKLNDNNNAIKYLKKFKTSSKITQARAYKLLGDANADLGKNADALDYYKKAAHHFEEDQFNSAEYLWYAAYLADRVMKDQKQAIDLYKEIKEKYPRTQQAFDADNYLAQMGIYNVN